MKKIGILGGAFDPPHLGHLHIAHEVQKTYHLDEIWFIPTYIAPHKETAETSAIDRAKMVKLMIKENKTFRIQTIELERKGKSYTIDTLQHLQQLYPMVRFYFIIGADLVMSLHTWKEIDALLEIVTFIGVSRPGYELQTKLPIDIIEIDTYDIASSDIRHRINTGKKWEEMVTDEVYEYIKENQLYGYRNGSQTHRTGTNERSL